MGSDSGSAPQDLPEEDAAEVAADAEERSVATDGIPLCRDPVWVAGHAKPPIDPMDLLVGAEVRQEVSIGSWKIGLREVSTVEQAWILEWARDIPLLKKPKEGEGPQPTPLPIIARTSLGTLAAHLVVINDKVLPDHIEETPGGGLRYITGAFEQRVHVVARMSDTLVTLLTEQVNFFKVRIGDALSAESLGNS